MTKERELTQGRLTQWNQFQLRATPSLYLCKHYRLHKDVICNAAGYCIYKGCAAGRGKLGLSGTCTDYEIATEAMRLLNT